MTGMAFPKVETAQRVSTVVSAATIVSVREHDIFVLVVADPMIAAFSLDQVLRSTAQPTLGAIRRCDARFLAFGCFAFFRGLGGHGHPFRKGTNSRK